MSFIKVLVVFMGFCFLFACSKTENKLETPEGMGDTSTMKTIVLPSVSPLPQTLPSTLPSIANTLPASQPASLPAVVETMPSTIPSW